MTDKIDPGWVNDRLPTEEDVGRRFDGWNGMVYAKWHNNPVITITPFREINHGTWWARITDENKTKTWSTETLATPQECIDRKKGEVQMTNEAYDELLSKIKELEQALDRKKGDEVEEYTGEDDKRTLSEKRADGNLATMEFRIKDSKEALAKEKSEHAETADMLNGTTDEFRKLKLENKELRQAWETLLEHNDQEDALSDKLEKELSSVNQCLKNKQEVADMFWGIIEKYETFIIKMARGG